MDEWPQGWFRGEQREGGAASSDDNGARGMDKSSDRTVGIPATNAAGQYQVGQYSAEATGSGGPGRSAPPGGWPDQPPATSRGGQGSLTASPWSPSGTGGPRLPAFLRWRGWLRPKRIVAVIAAVIVLLLLATVSTYFYLNSQLHRSNVLVSYPGRPAPGSGTNWLITGSDSRQGLTRAQERALSTGRDISGQRTDTIMILHLPAGGGRAVLISIPRDSYVNIPGHGPNKINAAFTFGGPKLLAQTVQNATGLYINHYMGIGFGGFVRVVNSVGGVRLCLATPLNDYRSGLHLKKGCHTLSGGQALAYVRDRHSFATSDLQREQDQRLFLKALLKKMTSTGVMLNPFAAIPAASNAASTLTVDSGASLYRLIGVARAMRNPITTTVPIANASYVTAAGDSVLWNSVQAKQLFNALRTDSKIPKHLITGSRQI
jgi:LCP family protein required for cell wall assembly